MLHWHLFPFDKLAARLTSTSFLTHSLWPQHAYNYLAFSQYDGIPAGPPWTKVRLAIPRTGFALPASTMPPRLFRAHSLDTEDM
jgi:hypothetical protein